MKSLLIAILVSLAGLTWLGIVTSQEPAPRAPSKEAPTFDELEALLFYLAGEAPEQRLAAEQRLRLGAKEHFDKLVELLPEQPLRGRELLLNMLVNTDAPNRVKLCVNTLCRQDAGRRERLSATAALRTVEEPRVLAAVKDRLAVAGLSTYERVQCCRVLGELTLNEAQQIAEAQRASAESDSLPEFFAEDALLRSILSSEFSQPAWSRYQRRRKEAPQVELRVIHGALVDLAQPSAMERAQAELNLAEMLGSDPRVLLALSRSTQPERAAFALAVLRRRPMGLFALATQAVMLDLVTSGEQMTALLAVDVAVAGAPPTPADLTRLRPVVSADAMSRLEAVLEGLTSAGNLAELRAQRGRVEAELVPLLRRFGPAHGEVQDLTGRLEEIGRSLDSLERVWRLGWRREFETDILGLKAR